MKYNMPKTMFWPHILASEMKNMRQLLILLMERESSDGICMMDTDRKPNLVHRILIAFLVYQSFQLFLGSCQLKKDKGGSQDGSVFLDVFQHYFNQVEKERQRNDILQQDVDRLRANRQEIIDMHDKQKMDERASFKEMIVAMCFNLNEKKREIRELSGLPPSEPPEIVFKESNTPSERVNKRIKVSSTEPGPDENDNASDLESISGEDESEAESEHEKVQAFDEILTQEDESIFDQPTQDAYEAETQVMDGHPDDYEEETQVQGTQPTQVLAEPETMAVSTMVGTSGTQLLPETESLDL
eukprot:m.70145 g.70145  ORF g.70145 m.70145 type:complete len:300 (+) comp12110_c0_seq3:377-1276(+)